MGPTWDPPGADRTQVGPMLAPWTMLFGVFQTGLVMLSNELMRPSLNSYCERYKLQNAPNINSSAIRLENGIWVSVGEQEKHFLCEQWVATFQITP